VPFNFFSISWVSGTVSLIDNTALIKRTTFPREVIPITAVLANCVHFAIQIGLLLLLVLFSGYKPSLTWVYLPFVAAFEVVFVCGLALMFSALDVYIRDTRYVVESANTVLFWLVPIFYSFNIVPKPYLAIYNLNPVAACVMAFRNILIENKFPAHSLMLNLVMVSSFTLALGFLIFGSLKKRFYDHL
jgi:ABC-type polysaccharide/polyol phosphate export permease